MAHDNRSTRVRGWYAPRQRCSISPTFFRRAACSRVPRSLARWRTALVAAPNYQAALACGFFTGFALAGVYPPAMKMISTWFRSQRGLAVGTIVGALTVGKAGPDPRPRHSRCRRNSGRPLREHRRDRGILACHLRYSDGPYPFPPRPFSWSLVATVFREPRWRARNRWAPRAHVRALQRVDVVARVRGGEHCGRGDG